MPGNPHEALHRMFMEGPALFARASQCVLDIQQYEKCEASELNTDLTEHQPIERRADTLLEITTYDGAKHIAIVEAQTGRDDDKRASWPYYIAYLYAKYRLPVVLLVICNDTAVAKWARHPIEIGPDGRPFVLAQPAVLGPDSVPMITELTEATDNVEFAILSALIHSKSKNAPAILDVLAPALNSIDSDKAESFAKLIAAGLGTAAAREYWSDLMVMQDYEWKSELTERLHAEGAAALLLQVLRARGIEVSEEVEERIQSCADPDTLIAWAQRAATADSLDEVFS